MQKMKGEVLKLEMKFFWYTAVSTLMIAGSFAVLICICFSPLHPCFRACSTVWCMQLLPDDQFKSSRRRSEEIKGTLGYSSILQEGEEYSFGVVLLELILAENL